MKPSGLVAITLAAMLVGCAVEDGSAGNLASVNASAEEEVLEPVNYAPGALNAASAFPPKEAPRLKRFIPVRPGRFVEWTYRDHLKPVGYRMGAMTVIVRGPESPALGYSGANFDWVIRQMRVSAPGRPEIVLESDIGAGFPTLLMHGRFDRAGTPFVLMQTETGGNHCCGELEIFVLRPKRIEHVEVDMGASYGTPDVRDVDGEGLVDFVVSDRAFLIRFTGWASGREPPKVLNVVDGEVRDVSARPGFRPVFRKAARELRRECLRPGGIEPNSACAAYVAAAGRAGDFKKAWAEMLKAHDKDSKEGLQCKLSIPDESCASSDLTYASYPDALRAFLRERGFPTS